MGLFEVHFHDSEFEFSPHAGPTIVSDEASEEAVLDDVTDGTQPNPIVGLVFLALLAVGAIAIRRFRRSA